MNNKPPHNTTVSLEFVTPAKAKEYLANLFPGQRAVRDNHIMRLASDIDAGNFGISPDALMFVNGQLANGQHRLHAIDLSGKGCWFVILRTEDERAFWFTDNGTPRLLRDLMPSMGLDHYTTEISSTASLVLQYDTGILCPHGVNARQAAAVTRTQTLEYVEKHAKELLEEVTLVRGYYGATRVVATSVGAAFLHLCNRNGDKRAAEFIHSVYYGDKQDASYDIRERLIKNARVGHVPRAQTFGLLIKAYRCYANGTRPGQLRLIEGEPYPQLP